MRRIAIPTAVLVRRACNGLVIVVWFHHTIAMTIHVNIFYMWLYIYAKPHAQTVYLCRKRLSWRFCFWHIPSRSVWISGLFWASMELRAVIISDKTVLSILILPLVSGSFGKSVLGSKEPLFGSNDGRRSSNDHH